MRRDPDAYYHNIPDTSVMKIGLSAWCLAWVYRDRYEAVTRLVRVR